MKLNLLVATAGAAVWLCGGVMAADPPASQTDYSEQDLVNGFKSPAPAASAAAADCNPDEDGVCQPPKDSRGFSLFGPDTSAPHGAKPSVAGPTRHHALVSASASAPPPPASRDLRINFELGSPELTERSKANASVFAHALSRPELADATFEIQGHTDASGSPVRNLALSQARADAVKAFVVSLGVDASRLKAVGYGADRPIDPKHPASAINRRVEAVRVN